MAVVQGCVVGCIQKYVYILAQFRPASGWCSALQTICRVASSGPRDGVRHHGRDAAAAGGRIDGDETVQNMAASRVS
jgi:hypothetical protein